jgi:hypothetical protein
MLTLPTASPASLDRLASASPAAGTPIDWETPIDRTRWYICETLTPLYYTPVYSELPVEYRRRYNQLTGMLTSEVIALLETEFLHAALSAVDASDQADPALHAAVVRFRKDEERHAEIWRRLNRLSEPSWYEQAVRRLVRLPAAAATLSRLLARHPIACPVVFWIQILQEERSVEISRRCMRMPAERIEPRYRAVFASHIQDEARHVQIDRHLIDRFYRPRSRMARGITARVFRGIVGSLLLAPVHSTMRVVEVLSSECAGLRPMLRRIRRELRALGGSPEYHQMMYSRQTTPITFSLFDEYEEFHQMRHVLRSYHPAPRVQVTSP